MRACLSHCLWYLNSSMEAEGSFFFNQDFDREVLTEQCALTTPMAAYLCRLFCSVRCGLFLYWAMLLLGQPSLFVLWMLALSCRQPLPSWDLSTHRKVSRCLLDINCRQLPWKGCAALLCTVLSSALCSQSTTPRSCTELHSCDWVRFHTVYISWWAAQPASTLLAQPCPGRSAVMPSSAAR